MAIEIGVILPTSTPDPRQPILGDVRAAARLAEELGLGSVWSTDHLIASAPMLESTVVLATAAAVTERVRVGFGAMLLALRPVAWAAKQVAALQYVSGNRVLLGVATGNPAHGDAGFRAAGVSFADRGRRTDAALGVLPDLIAGRTAVLPDATEATLAPGALVPPILIAGNGARARRRAAQFGDGWMVMQPDLAALDGEIAELRQLAADLGRPAPSVTVVAPSLAADQARAGAELASYAAAGVERVVLAPTGADWESDYQRAAGIQAVELCRDDGLTSAC
ncbi:MAG TPA: LLM class flavin-dependent oxidoreductase [Streptosporangiaceae bacterium]